MAVKTISRIGSPNTTCGSFGTAVLSATPWRNWAGNKGNPHLAAALSGAFSRVELPEIVAQLGGAARVLYTDCDVIFVAEVVPELEANPCEYFAVAPEGTQDDYVNMNTGVMLMNIDRLRESLPEFREYISQNLAELEKRIVGRSGLSLVLPRRQRSALGSAETGTELETVLGRERRGENHPFPWTEAVSARPHRIALAGAEIADRRRVSRAGQTVVRAPGGSSLAVMSRADGETSSKGQRPPSLDLRPIRASWRRLRGSEAEGTTRYLSATANRCTWSGMPSRVLKGCSP